MKVRITRSRRGAWYYGMCGDEFEVVKKEFRKQTVYDLVEDEGKTCRRYIDGRDCEEVIPEPPEPPPIVRIEH